MTAIKKVARTDPVTAGDGVISLMERIWPAFQDVDTSSGALGGAVYWAQDELLPIAIEAPADRKTRNTWLDRLWQAIEGDGVDYLSLVQDRRGELCGSLSRASRDFLNKDARFCLEVGQLAIQGILEGYGYELTGIDVLDALNHYMTAAQTIGIASQARADVLAIATKQPGAASDILIRQCSVELQQREAPPRSTWTVAPITLPVSSQ